MPYAQVETDKKIKWKNSMEKPVATLADENGGRAQIVNDDHCYVLLLQRINKDGYRMTSWWFKEAVEVLQGLPLPK